MNELSWILLILAVASFYLITVRAAARIGNRNCAYFQVIEQTRVLKRGVWKINKTVALFRANLDRSKLRTGKDKYTHYYIAYLNEIARAISKRHQIEFSPAFQLPVLVEANRLCGRGEKDILETEKLLEHILASEPGKRGAADGRVDGDYAVNSFSGGPYFEKIAAYFQN